MQAWVHRLLSHTSIFHNSLAAWPCGITSLLCVVVNATENDKKFVSVAQRNSLLTFFFTIESDYSSIQLSDGYDKAEWLGYFHLRLEPFILYFGFVLGLSSGKRISEYFNKVSQLYIVLCIKLWSKLFDFCWFSSAKLGQLFRYVFSLSSLNCRHHFYIQSNSRKFRKFWKMKFSKPTMQYADNSDFMCYGFNLNIFNHDRALFFICRFMSFSLVHILQSFTLVVNLVNYTLCNLVVKIVIFWVTPVEITVADILFIW